MKKQIFLFLGILTIIAMVMLGFVSIEPYKRYAVIETNYEAIQKTISDTNVLAFEIIGLVDDLKLHQQYPELNDDKFLYRVSSNHFLALSHYFEMVKNSNLNTDSRPIKNSIMFSYRLNDNLNEFKTIIFKDKLPMEVHQKMVEFFSRVENNKNQLDLDIKRLDISIKQYNNFLISGPNIWNNKVINLDLTDEIEYGENNGKN